MKFNVAESDLALITKTYSSRLHTAPANLRKYSVCKNSLHNTHREMDLGQHISDISSKATKTLGFLFRNLAFALRSTKEVAYNSLVSSNLDYAAPI